jgi:uncharacterized flavoprotein (TIGR03862 family)
MSIAIIGSGPAGLMAATVASAAGFSVSIFEARAYPARKLFLAGRTGLNIANDDAAETWCAALHAPKKFSERLWKAWPTNDWLKFIESLGIKTFKGPTGRIFVEGLAASPFIRAWRERLKAQGVTFHLRHELVDFSSKTNQEIQLHFSNDKIVKVAAVCLALGGASWERKMPSWLPLLASKNISIKPLTASNAGFSVDWPKALLSEAEGLPLKNIILKTKLGERSGELVLTRYGLEGTPIYRMGTKGVAMLDLKPDLTIEEIIKKLSVSKENLSPIRRVKKNLNLSTAAMALLHHVAPKSEKTELKKMAQLIKSFPILLGERQGLSRSISSAGGVKLSELNAFLMVKSMPRLFLAGEMLDWDAPTGGYLIHACAAQGLLAGRGMVAFLSSPLCVGHE